MQVERTAPTFPQNQPSSGSNRRFLVFHRRSHRRQLFIIGLSENFIRILPSSSYLHQTVRCLSTAVYALSRLAAKEANRNGAYQKPGTSAVTPHSPTTAKVSQPVKLDPDLIDLSGLIGFVPVAETRNCGKRDC